LGNLFFHGIHVQKMGFQRSRLWEHQIDGTKAFERVVYT
jgi:hypothetical protein